FSAAVVLAWSTGNASFHPSIAIILDITPWAITFYTLTLVAASAYQFWDDLVKRPALVVGLLLDTLAVGVYAAFTVIWRHDSAFVPGAPVYVVTGALLLTTVALCYSCQK
ncbi:MAG: hypothetical protein JZU65_04990, partial [Chlorobium sp.]|nr:hypothetical protein [Chlorobium sp.]